MLNIAYVGALYHAKGLYNFDNIIDECERSNLNVTWTVIGWIATPSEFKNYKGVTCYGSYKSTCELYDALDYYNIDLVIMPNECAESFSYIMSEVWNYGIPILGTDRGAVQSRIDETHCGWSCHSNAMCGVITYILQHPEVYDEMLYHVESYRVPDLQDMYKNYNELYKKLIIDI
jgi:hypothetical protein